MSDSYYELVDGTDRLGEKFVATDMVRSTWSAAIGTRAETNYGPDGIGTTIGTLFDESGAVGGIQQSVLVRPRAPKH
jgi:hypothetical protein